MFELFKRKAVIRRGDEGLTQPWPEGKTCFPGYSYVQQHRVRFWGLVDTLNEIKDKVSAKNGESLSLPDFLAYNAGIFKSLVILAVNALIGIGAELQRYNDNRWGHPTLPKDSLDVSPPAEEAAA